MGINERRAFFESLANKWKYFRIRFWKSGTVRASANEEHFSKDLPIDGGTSESVFRKSGAVRASTNDEHFSKALLSTLESVFENLELCEHQRTESIHQETCQ